MSGICAAWRRGHPEQTSATIASICLGLPLHTSEQIRTAVDGPVGIGMAAAFPNQQIYETPELLVVCEAEIYDQVEAERGVNGDSSTAAAIASLYQRSGAAFLEKVRGEFSLVIWDRRNRILLAATDRFGIHPLVYYEDHNVLLVASRIDALLQDAAVPRSINPRALAVYFNYGITVAPETIFSKVSRLLPGTYLLATPTEVSIGRYWDMRYEVERPAKEAALSERLESLVEESVRAHCKEDDFSQMGAFLSGGTDSSTVVGMMSRLQRGPVKTFSIGFDDPAFNELDYARITARAYQAAHHEYLVSAADCVEALPHMVRCYDEPFGNSSAIPTYFCARLAAQNGVPIVLTGDGGDELFGGNERYRIDKIFEVYQQVPGFLRKGLIEPVLAHVPVSSDVVGKAKRYIRRSNFPQPYRYFSYNPVLEDTPEEMFTAGFLDTLNGYSVLETPSRYYWEGPARDHLNRLLYIDVKMTLGDNDLPKVTRMSELAGIRPRFPFLDPPVAEFSGRIPPGMKVKGFEKRYLFKRAFRNVLPVEVIRKKKHGFGIPVAHWMKTDKRMREITRDVLGSAITYQRGYLRREYVDELFRKHENDVTPFYGDILWTLLVLELWFRRCVDAALRPAA
jgi:asparagine synthase (glutamine-hydrolysing)